MKKVIELSRDGHGYSSSVGNHHISLCTAGVVKRYPALRKVDKFWVTISDRKIDKANKVEIQHEKIWFLDKNDKREGYNTAWLLRALRALGFRKNKVYIRVEY